MKCNHVNGFVVGNQLPYAVAGICDNCGEETIYMNVKMVETEDHVKIFMPFGMVTLDKE